MHLTKLILEQFRNYQKLELDFDLSEPITYFVGPNAQGKTNILESIYLLALTKSFRTTKQQDMIGWEYEYARVKGFFAHTRSEADALQSKNGASSIDQQGQKEESETLELEAFLGKPPHPQKSFKKNDVKTSAANFIGNCQVVFFHPEDLNMLYLGPDLRRAYLNVMNVQINRKYFSALRSYQKVLKQRNALLRTLREQRDRYASDIHGFPENDLNVWDEQLVEYGSYLMLERAKTVTYFQNQLTETYRKISQGHENVNIIYHHTLASTELPTDELTLRASFAQELAESRSRDFQALVTTKGPHRDDLEFSFHNLKLSAHASRGEYRSLLLALKLIELKFFKERVNSNPILLLDDVFSELDPNRQNLLLQAIEGHQTIITTTHLNQEPFEHTGKHVVVVNTTLGK